MSKHDIISAIEGRIRGIAPYSAWRIGLTHEPEERKTHWKNNENQDIRCWTEWQANSLTDAQDIESFFINVKGMKGGTGGDLSPWKITFVYIF